MSSSENNSSSRNSFSEDEDSEKEIIGICAYEPGCDTVSYSYTIRKLGKRKCKRCTQLWIFRFDTISKMCENTKCNLIYDHCAFPSICPCSQK